MQPAVIKNLLSTYFTDGKIEVNDLTGGGDHFQALVITPAFQGKTLVERHQMVYAALGDLLRQEIHALALQTYTPEQWEQRS